MGEKLKSKKYTDMIGSEFREMLSTLDMLNVNPIILFDDMDRILTNSEKINTFHIIGFSKQNKNFTLSNKFMGASLYLDHLLDNGYIDIINEKRKEMFKIIDSGAFCQATDIFEGNVSIPFIAVNLNEDIEETMGYLRKVFTYLSDKTILRKVIHIKNDNIAFMQDVFASDMFYRGYNSQYLSTMLRKSLFMYIDFQFDIITADAFVRGHIINIDKLLGDSEASKYYRNRFLYDITADRWFPLNIEILTKSQELWSEDNITNLLSMLPFVNNEKFKLYQEKIYDELNTNSIKYYISLIEDFRKMKNNDREDYEKNKSNESWDILSIKNLFG